MLHFSDWKSMTGTHCNDNAFIAQPADPSKKSCPLFCNVQKMQADYKRQNQVYAVKCQVREEENVSTT